MSFLCICITSCVPNYQYTHLTQNSTTTKLRGDKNLDAYDSLFLICLYTCVLQPTCFSTWVTNNIPISLTTADILSFCSAIYLWTHQPIHLHTSLSLFHFFLFRRLSTCAPTNPPTCPPWISTYVDGGSRKAAVDGHDGALKAIGRGTVGSGAVTHVERTVITRLAQGRVPFHLATERQVSGRWEEERVGRGERRVWLRGVEVRCQVQEELRRDVKDM